MGKQKYLEDVMALFDKSPVISYNSIARIITSKKRVKQYTKQLIRNLILKGKIKRITKGYYSLYEDPSLIVFCFKPAYLGLQDALSLHNLWEQETIPIIITSRKVRPGIRKIFGSNVMIRTMDQRYMFGYDYKKQGNLYLPYSDIEKTLIDFIYFKLGGKITKGMKNQVNAKRLNLYLKRYPVKVRQKALSTIDTTKK
jgi:predicted transcriptional regulator of viral defense system